MTTEEIKKIMESANDGDVLMSAGASGYESGIHYREPGLVSKEEYREYCTVLGSGRGVHADLGTPLALMSVGCGIIVILGYKGMTSTDIYDWELGSSSYSSVAL